MQGNVSRVIVTEWRHPGRCDGHVACNLLYFLSKTTADGVQSRHRKPACPDGPPSENFAPHASNGMNHEQCCPRTSHNAGGDCSINTSQWLTRNKHRKLKTLRGPNRLRNADHNALSEPTNLRYDARSSTMATREALRAKTIALHQSIFRETCGLNMQKLSTALYSESPSS